MKKILEEIAANNSRQLKPMIDLVNIIRPSSFQKMATATQAIEQLIGILQINPDLRLGFQSYLFRIIKDRDPLRLLVDLGINPATGFFHEFMEKIYHKFLPVVPQTFSLGLLLEKVFHKKTDCIWIESIPNNTWAELMKMVEFLPINQLDKNSNAIEYMFNAILITSLRISSIGLESEIIDRIPELAKLDSPFLAQNLEVDQFIEDFKVPPTFEESLENEGYNQVFILLSQCEIYIDLIRKNKNDLGITLHITFVLLRLTQNIDRLKTLMGLLHNTIEGENIYETEIVFFKKLIKLDNQKNSLTNHLKSNINLLALQITEHASKTGEHYVTTNHKEYWRMLLAALGGGFIVAFLTIFKTCIYYQRLPLFGSAFLYSLNYSFGFMFIQVTKSTLATKQSAMTATHIAHSLGNHQFNKTVDIKEKSENFAELIAQVFRSQLIALFGNILMVFPIAYGVSWLFKTYAQIYVVDIHKAEVLISDSNPIHSYALFHAAITGVYLFLAGLISGYYDNQTVSHQIPKRLRHHPLLVRILPKKVLNRFANYINHNLGVLMGNFWIGFLMGCTGSLGLILGLPLDVRHITFSMGNFALALVALDNKVEQEVVIITLLGIAAIGLVNLMVSFGLALYVAIRSRGIGIRQSSTLFWAAIGLFLKKPMRFLFPPRA